MGVLPRAVALCAAGLLVATGCVSTTTVACDDGSTCPAASACVAVAFLDGEARTVCALPGQVAACEGREEGAACALAGVVASGACHTQVCVPAGCGNRLLDPGEVCEPMASADGGACAADCRSDLRCGNGVVDPAQGEACDLGDAIGHDGCTSGCALERPRWSAVGDARPAPRAFATMAYDLSRRSAVLFGGATAQGVPLDDTRAWDGDRWRAIPTDTAPSNRYAHVMAYDVARQQLVVFSGVNNQADTWVTVDGAWRQVVTAHAPPARDYASMVYDSARGQIVLFGGFSTVTQTSLADTWVWDGVDWREVTPATRPPALVGAAMAYDARRALTVMFGGAGTSSPSNEVWEFDGTTWANRTPTSGAAPSPRAFAAMAFDSVSGELLMAGGGDGALAPLHDAFTWNGARWRAVASIPIADPDEDFFAAAAASDPLRGRVIVLETRYGRLYEWGPQGWATPTSDPLEAAAFAPREGAAMALDLARNELVLVGGEVDAGAALTDETWLFDGDSWRRSTPSPRPSARWGAALAYDEVRDEVLLYGGCPASADTWRWRGATRTWTLVSAASAPGPLCGAAAAFDAARGEVVLIGGADGGGASSAATWTWDGAAWQRASMTLPPRRNAAVTYDRERQRVIVFGGVGAASLDLADTWSWDGTAWTPLTPATPPPGRVNGTLAWDPARGRAVLVGGFSNEGQYVFADAYEWSGTDWAPLPSDYPPRAKPILATSPDGAGVVLAGGATGTLRLRWDGDGGYEACGDLDTDGDGLTGCDDPDCAWACAPGCPPATSCPATGPRCGDGVCNAALESCARCPGDCGACAAACGDFTCNGAETLASCPGDCTP